MAAHSGDDGAQFRFGLEQFLCEARTLAQLDHPNTVRVRQFFEANGTAYLVMDYYQGLSLAEYLDQQGGRIPEEQAKQLMHHRKGHQGPWTDIYSAAAVLYRMVTGEAPPASPPPTPRTAAVPATYANRGHRVSDHPPHVGLRCANPAYHLGLDLTGLEALTTPPRTRLSGIMIEAG